MKKVFIIGIIFILVIVFGFLIFNEVEFDGDYSKLSSVKECEKKGGLWAHGQAGPGGCVGPSSDGGNECSDSDECELGCFPTNNEEVGTVTNGSCLKYDSIFKYCGNSIKDGIVTPSVGGCP